MSKHLQVVDHIPPYCLLPGFLGDSLIETLLVYVKNNQVNFKVTKVGTGKGLIDSNTRISRSVKLGELSELLLSHFQEIKSIAISKLKISDFDLDHCEMELVAHEDGAFYQCHTDLDMTEPQEKTQRILTGVYYFNHLPKSFSGGQLRLFSLSTKHHLDIEPERDRLVLFPAWAPHEVMPVSCPSGLFEDARFAINCWYHRKNPAFRPHD